MREYILVSPELLSVPVSHLLAGVPEAKEYPCCDVDQEVGDYREAVPH